MKLPKILKPFYCDGLIRVGKDNDGGYLVNKEDIVSSNRLISFGVGDDISFEQQFYDINPCSLDAYDGTINNTYEFFTDNKTFHRKNIHKNIDDIIQDSVGIFLKCDIEGSEYDILDSLIKYSNRFSGIVLEFHHVNRYELFNELTAFISKIDQKLVHVHANNNSYIETPTDIIPDCLELSFTSSRNIEYSNELILPHPLDMPNEQTRNDIAIVF